VTRRRALVAGPDARGSMDNAMARTTVRRNLSRAKQRDARLKSAGHKVVSGLREAARGGRYKSAVTGRFVGRRAA
jgi:hypothetical protein